MQRLARPADEIEIRLRRRPVDGALSLVQQLLLSERFEAIEPCRIKVSAGRKIFRFSTKRTCCERRRCNNGARCCVSRRPEERT